jgi:uncharacterized membrane protein
MLMTPCTSCSFRRPLLFWLFTAMAGLAGSAAQADPLYSITDLGTLPGKTSSVATAISNQGQVAGISYNGPDGYFTDVFQGSANPPRFTVTANGAQSFLYGSGQMTQINPTGGLAMSINNSGQVVGGQYSSIDDLGQYVGGQTAGIVIPNPSTTSEFVSHGTTTTLSPLFVPYSLNNSGQIAGLLIVNADQYSRFHPAVDQSGQITDLVSKVPHGNYYDTRAIAINQIGDTSINVQPEGQKPLSYLYVPSTGAVINLSALPGGSNMIGAALNDKDQVVGNGFLYSNGTIQTLASLVSSSSGWSNLVSTRINDTGQIVGQGLINGQEHAFLMTPTGQEVPEPGTLAIWGLISAGLALQL